MAGNQLPEDLRTLIDIYNRRAANYDDSWHPDLAKDIISWFPPRPGDRILDLACGTGLVTYLASERAGTRGLVVGVDASPGMLEIAKAKATNVSGSPRNIIWLLSNIDSEETFQREELRKVDAFDIIYCCSAMPLIPDPPRTLALWSRLLRPGGKIVFDYPTERTTTLGLLVHDVPRALGIHVPFSWRDWMKGQKSLVDAVEHAGLELITVTKTKSYVPEMELRPEQSGEVFREAIETSQKNSELAKPDVREQARETFRREFEREAQKNGGLFTDGHWLYVVVAQKRKDEI
ncbi:ubiE/COQ5 methyltransferase [Paecilomyces variotii No. 5]|uniref:UbiE/COQ5 methyltransferase n=1 Tax=Byssochlamys spectabilis (strain No. 5 / NBRC 109023) TaxID=1356009 RepID=V5FY45_BYSSN|nr:ubiE/COQ5 methyltransferase [Paecilomyces variotii No. 5]